MNHKEVLLKKGWPDNQYSLLMRPHICYCAGREAGQITRPLCTIILVHNILCFWRKFWLFY